MHLSNVLKRTCDHETSVGEVEALAGDPRKIQDFGHDHTVIPARQVVGYVIAQHHLSG
jgi:hypothetical protein